MSAADGGAPWQEPVRGGYPEAWMLSLSGRQRIATWNRGLAPTPPLYHLTGSRPTGSGDGTAEAEMPGTVWLTNSAGLIGGGTLAILADIAFGVSVETQLPAATPYTTAELSLTFVRPVRPGSLLTAHGQAIHVGRSIALSEVFLIDPRGDRLVAHGTSRIAILPRLDGIPDAPEHPAEIEVPDYGSPDPFEREPPIESILDQAVFDELPGIEIVRRQIDGKLARPAIYALTGLAPTAVGEGTATAVLPASEWLNTPARRLQGGAITMLADFAMLIAVLTTAPAGVAIAGVDLKVNFLRPVAGDGRDLTAHAEVEHAGKTLAVTRGRVENADGKPVMLATGSAMYLPNRPADLDPETELSDA